MSLTTIATYRISTSQHPFNLIVAQGSVIDFSYPTNPAKSAIVNAANEGCLGGGGVDGAIGNAGGPKLFMDRQDLPEVTPGSEVRCLTGNAVTTGPNSYGTLQVPHVIHAVGPNYLHYKTEKDLLKGDKLLSSAYTCSMECAKTINLEAMAFCLLSAGLFRGQRSVKHVLEIGLKSIATFEGYEGLREVYVCGFTRKELATLTAVAEEIGLKKFDPTKIIEEESRKENDTTNNDRNESGSDNTDNATKQQQPNNEEKKEKIISGEEENNQTKTAKTETDDKREEWEIRRDELKSTGDGHFRTKSYALAIQAYSDALQLDPANHIILSNKSAAHLANGEKSKALHDAKKCVEHNPSWAKGHTRLAAAMSSLGRINEAAGVYSKVLNELDPNNAAAKKGLEDCRSRQQKAREEKEREARELQMELDRKKAEKEDEEKCKNDEANGGGGGGEGDDLLDDFFSEVEKATEKPKPKVDEEATSREEATNRIKTQITDLGTSTSQIDRLLQVNHEWKNLNPFYVLDIPHIIDDDSIITARYRALSLLVHPDKCLDDPVRAKDAFEQVKKAMTQMNDEDKRRHVRALIDQGMKQGKRDWEAEKANGNPGTLDAAAKDEEGLTQAQNTATMKIFAEIEQKRRNIERRKRGFEQRERAQEDEEKEKEKNERDHDKRWREGERVDKRIGNWRNFQGGSKGEKKGKFS